MVIQPNVVTRDGKAGVQTGKLGVITESGVESLHRFPGAAFRCSDARSRRRLPHGQKPRVLAISADPTLSGTSTTMVVQIGIAPTLTPSTRTVFFT